MQRQADDLPSCSGPARPLLGRLRKPRLRKGVKAEEERQMEYIDMPRTTLAKECSRRGLPLSIVEGGKRRIFRKFELAAQLRADDAAKLAAKKIDDSTNL